MEKEDQCKNGSCAPINACSREGLYSLLIIAIVIILILVIYFIIKFLFNY